MKDLDIVTAPQLRPAIRLLEELTDLRRDMNKGNGTARVARPPRIFHCLGFALNPRRNAGVDPVWQGDWVRIWRYATCFDGTKVSLRT